MMRKLKDWISSLSYRTGIIVLAVCLMSYLISFAQMLLPIPLAVKSALWVLFFGLAKAAQYTALLILGKAGISDLKRRLRRRRQAEED